MATPREVVTQVHDISWLYTARLRQRETRHGADWYQPGRKGFYKEPAFNVSCERRFHYTDSYVCGYITTDCGSGCTMSTPIYCYEDVYDDWCSYDYYEWPVIATKTTEGADHQVYWDHFAPNGPLQREQCLESYEVNFSAPDDAWQYRPRKLTDFVRFTPGDTWRLQVGRIRRHNIERMTKLDFTVTPTPHTPTPE